MGKYILHPKTDDSVTFSVRTKNDILSEFDTLSRRTGRSRNELVNIAMKYFVETVELGKSESTKSTKKSKTQ